MYLCMCGYARVYVCLHVRSCTYMYVGIFIRECIPFLIQWSDAGQVMVEESAGM